MKNKYLKFTLLLFCLVSIQNYAQNTLVADINGNTDTQIDIDGEDVVLTQNASDQKGAIFYSEPYNLTECAKFRVEFDFRVFDSNNSEPADGFAFWYLENPPTNFGAGQSLGMPADANGIKVCFDTYDNDNNDFFNHRPNPEVQLSLGVGYNETFPEAYFNTDNANDFNIRSATYKHATIIYNEGNLTVTIEGENNENPIIDHDFADSNYDITFTEGYFGFSASTGLYTDRHSIKNVEVYVDNVVLDSNDETIAACDNDGDGFETFDLTSVEDNVIVDPGSGIGYIYYETFTDAEAGNGNIIDPATWTTYQNTDAYTDQTVYVRIFNASGCFNIASIQLSLQGIELLQDSVTIPGNCDDNLDGVEFFDLTNQLASFINDPASYSFEYYTDLNSAETQDPTNQITSPENYEVIAGTSNIAYIRIEDNNTDCVAYATINTSAFITPVVEDIQDINQCGDDSITYDLTVNDNNILGSQDASTFSIFYFESQADADSNTDPILSPENYATNSLVCETVYARIENNTQPDCYATSSFQLCPTSIVLGTPTSPINSCATNTTSTTFDLTVNEVAILNGESASDYIITYYASQNDADTNTGAYTDAENYTVSSNGCETVFVRVESVTESTCYETTSFEICTEFVNPGMPVTLSECSSNEDPTIFNITQNESTILNGETYNISYYESLTEADNSQNEITELTNYQALNNTQTIYVRVESTSDNTCYTVVSFDIESISGGLTTNELNLTVCENELEGELSLTDAEDQLNLSSTESLEGYYTSLTDAVNQIDPITNPSAYNNTDATTEFFIRVENSDASICYAITRLTITTEICELIIPEGFSPNADGMNDNFEITGLYENYRFDLKIYQRNGRKIYDGTNNTTPWNGSFDGHELPVGTYYYVLDIKSPDSRMYKGWVYLNK